MKENNTSVLVCQAPTEKHPDLFIKVSTKFLQQLKNLGDSDLKILLSLALRVNGDGKAWPSIAGIATDSGKSRSTVMRCLKHLEDKHLIQVFRGMENHQRAPNSYKVNGYFHFGSSVTHDTTPPEVKANDHRGSVTSDTGVVSPMTQGTRSNELDIPDTTYLDKEKSLSSISTDIETNVLPEKPVIKPIPVPQVTKCPAAVPRVPATGATALERGEFIAAEKNKPAALYFALCHLIPKAKLTPPGGGAKCPGIGRLGRMAQLYGGWAVVHQQIEYAALDVQFGKAAAGDILSWIEGRLKGRVSGKTIRGYKLPTNEQLAQSWRGIAVSDEEI